MRHYILRRILIAIPILIGVSIVTFTFANFAPGDPVSALIRPGSSDIRPESLEKLREHLGLNRPWIERYSTWLGLQPIAAAITGDVAVPGILEGNLGVSLLDAQPIGKLLGDRIPNTIKLMGAALIISLLLGIALGVLSAFRQGTRLDNVLTTIVFAGISLPSYLIALLTVVLFAVLPFSLWGLKLFPATGLQDPITTAPPILDSIWHMILPVAVLSFGLTATFLRYTRASVLEVMRQDHVTTARSKGLPEGRVRLRHILRNALLPVVTVIGLVIPQLITSGLFVERLFNLPGVAGLSIQATELRDYPTIMAVALLVSTAVVVSNLITDIAYAFVDPRIRYS